MTRVGDDKRGDRALLADCVHAATLAPSIYNTQPWRFRIRDGCIDVLADPLRALPAVDPDGREMHISLGAAVLNIEVILTANGLLPDVVLLPDRSEPGLAARVSYAGEVTPDLRDLAMVSALARRQTCRSPFQEHPLPEALALTLTDAARREGATLTLLDDVDSRALLALVRTADSRLHEDPAYRAELVRWTTDYPNRLDGVLPESFGAPSIDAALPVRDFGRYQPWLERVPERYEEHPTITVLSTLGDAREDWLRAGMALERVLLEATIAGVSASFLTQPLEVAHLRRLYDERVPHTSSQMAFRLGYPRHLGATRSPRRPVAEVLVDD